MTWPTLKAIRDATRIEFTAALAARHNFVRLASGRWARVLGPPASDAVLIRARVYHLPARRFPS